MFVLKDDSKFEWTVKAKVPVNGKKVGLNFQATFNVVTQEVLDELIVNKETRDHKRFLEMTLVKFEGVPVQDDNGKDIDDVEQRNQMLRESSLFVNPLVQAYIDGAAGHHSKN